MEMKVSFDKEKLFNWLNEDCKIDCENCPLEGYVCDTLIRACHEECIKKIFKGDE